MAESSKKISSYDEYLERFFPNRGEDNEELLERDPRALGVELAKRSLSKIDGFKALTASIHRK